MDRDKAGNDVGTTTGGVDAGRGTIGRPVAGWFFYKSGRAELPLGQAARQRRPTWFKAPRRGFETVQARQQPDLKRREYQPNTNQKAKCSNQRTKS